MTKYLSFFLLLPLLVQAQEPESLQLRPLPVRDLYKVFQNPPAEARPFVRWWWSNNQVEIGHINTELDAFKAAGIGGVEVNPILDPAFSWERKRLSSAPFLTWLSPEWNQLLLETGKSVRERGMIMDLLGGSGWPFGGDFLEQEDTAYRLVLQHERVKGPGVHQVDLAEIMERKPPYMRSGYKKAGNATEELLFIHLLPANMQAISEVHSLALPEGKETKQDISIPAGEYVLAFGVLEQDFRYVGNAVKGANGPALNHFSEQATRNYMSRLFSIEEDWDVPLSTYIRAIFSDSIELTRSNYTPGMLEAFRKDMGYDIRPYLPLVLMPEEHTRKMLTVSDRLQETLRRARHDWSRYQVSTFLEGFTRPYITLCEEKDLLARYQSGGNPSYMGIQEGAMLPHIPEAENWLYRKEYLAHDAFYERIWTTQKSNIKYNATAANLMGRRIASAESMTNVTSLFQVTLAQMKQALDVNLIGGLNHTVLHGATYSPPDVPFPGLIRFGTFVSPHNSWWPYFRHFADYSARLSAVFQHTRMEGGIAVLGPGPDVWGQHGLNKYKLVNQPNYIGSIWKSLAELGINSDYLHGDVLKNAAVNDGVLQVGPMSYRLLLVIEAAHVDLEVGQVLQAFAESGGSVIYVGQVPSRVPGLTGSDQADPLLRKAVTASLKAGAKQAKPPVFKGDLNELRTWLSDLITQADYEALLRIESPREGFYASQRIAADAQVLFFTNTHRFRNMETRICTTLEGKGLYIWDPQTGLSRPYPLQQDDAGFTLSLQPMESLLLITGARHHAMAAPKEAADETVRSLGPWNLHLTPIHEGESFTLELDKLVEFTRHLDPRLQRFSGIATYTTSFQNSGMGDLTLHLGNQNDHICEVFLNGTSLGVSWYGEGVFDLSPHVQAGKNDLKIRYTTTLFNGLIGTETFNRFWNKWHKGKTPELEPTGLLGPVLLKYR